MNKWMNADICALTFLHGFQGNFWVLAFQSSLQPTDYKSQVHTYSKAANLFFLFYTDTIKGIP